MTQVTMCNVICEFMTRYELFLVINLKGACKQSVHKHTVCSFEKSRLQRLYTVLKALKDIT